MVILKCHEFFSSYTLDSCCQLSGWPLKSGLYFETVQWLGYLVLNYARKRCCFPEDIFLKTLWSVDFLSRQALSSFK